MKKSFKLQTHQKSFSPEDLVLNPKDHNDLKKGDVVEIYPKDQKEQIGCRLLLQITVFKDDNQYRDRISIESSVASAFNLKSYTDVYINKVNPSEVALDSIEITFKDQYMGRSEMWRLKSYLTNTCVYINKKIEFCNTLIRCQIYEMWSKGDRVACGVVTDDTKVVFRSSTSMVYLFIQMSSEMWDFDIHGDLYFEKAVNGFLVDLFGKWKKMASNHEVTIVLFSRTYYESPNLEDYPAYMRECLQVDFKGRVYEDFYRVAIQNERNDDWFPILVELRRLFTAYQGVVLHYHEKPGIEIPKATNSTASQGNFLEVLNISLNVFEKHYMDRSFDRTGQMSVVITPGVGVFEVDRELTNITKQRIIDNGVGSDLVCVGEQPLHAVPLLKFQNNSVDGFDDYSLPHWINLSFYSSNKKVAYSTFVPRIKLPPQIKQKSPQRIKFAAETQNEYVYNSLFDYDAYDAEIFNIPTSNGATTLQKSGRIKKTSVPSMNKGSSLTKNVESSNILHSTPRRKMSDPNINYSAKGNIMNRANVSLNTSYEKISTLSSSAVPGRALINPFDPSHVTVKLTSNRRRWTHIFPKGPTGVLIQQHHYQSLPSSRPPSRLSTETSLMDGNKTLSNSLIKESLDAFDSTLKLDTSIKSTSSGYPPFPTYDPSKSLTLLWGATGEQEWTPAMTTGVDWKSLTIPACLPITTDYFPDKRSLHNDYVVSDYTLLPEDISFEISQSERTCLTTAEVFTELISQRLAQGFQLILLPDNRANEKQLNSTLKGNSIIGFNHPNLNDDSKEYLLSIGRIFHRISLNASIITVTRYRPRHPYPPINVDYRYRFRAPNHDEYETSSVHFTTEKLENFNWNYLDQYICTRGDIEYVLTENLKYWRYRMYLLPKEHSATRKIQDGLSKRCDIYSEEPFELSPDDFMRFIESHLNKVKRINSTKRVTKGSPIQHSTFTTRRNSTSMVGRSANQNTSGQFRERVLSSVPDSRPNITKFNNRHPSLSSNIGRISPAKEVNDQGNMENTDEVILPLKILKVNAPLEEFIEAMKNPVTGLSFFVQSSSLPSNTFISKEAYSWLERHLDIGGDPMVILQSLHKADLIRHASGDQSVPIIYGIYFYYITTRDNEKEFIPPQGNFRMFENEWMEIELPLPTKKPIDTVPNFLRESPEILPIVDHVYKQMYLDIDNGQKSDRKEWGHMKYHRIMRPHCAYEIIVQWITASGPIVSDVIFQLFRKAFTSTFQLVPIPAIPLPELNMEKTDPLRGPIFIPLNFSCLLNCVTETFKAFPKSTWNSRLIMFQEEILKRYGFMPCILEPIQKSNRKFIPTQFIHCTGHMSASVISDRFFEGPDFDISDEVPNNEIKSTVISDVTKSLHATESENTITRKLGFFMSWNHMIPNKKWKSMAISKDNELIQIRIMEDMKEFSANNSMRLVNFWNECVKQIQSNDDTDS